MKKEFNLGRDALVLAIMTVLTVLTWIFVDIYSTLKKTTIPEVTRQQMQPLDPKIKKELIENLKTKIWFEKEDINSFLKNLESNPESTPSTSSAQAEEIENIIPEE